jgi:S-adenosylmethionine:diacylglycerol 3-amino-3-carboxypropyl transferase
LQVCFKRRDGRRRHRGRELPLKDHYFLWQHFRRYTYPDLTLASGRGQCALELAREAAGLEV